MDIEQNSVENPAELKAKLETEAKEYCELSKQKRSSYSTKEEFMYIINRNWLAKWKKYVDYQYIKENSKSYYHSHSFNRKEYQCDQDSFPGVIDNEFLIVPFNEFLNDGDNSNIYNYVIRHNVDQKRDIKILNKKYKDKNNNNPLESAKVIGSLFKRSYSISSIITLFI